MVFNREVFLNRKEGKVPRQAQDDTQSSLSKILTTNYAD